MELAMVNDKILSIEELPPSYIDRVLFFGDGVYEVVRSYNGRIFALDEHLERFKRSLKAIEITWVDITKIRQHVESAFEKVKSWIK